MNIRMKTRKLAIIHLVLFFLIHALLFFLSETILDWLFPGIHGVETWLNFLLTGVVVISVLTAISYTICLTIVKQRNPAKVKS
jgi:uncharacterized protein involved in cysteine biosynthesis